MSYRKCTHDIASCVSSYYLRRVLPCELFSERASTAYLRHVGSIVLLCRPLPQHRLHSQYRIEYCVGIVDAFDAN